MFVNKVLSETTFFQGRRIVCQLGLVIISNIQIQSFTIPREKKKKDLNESVRKILAVICTSA